MSMSDFDMYVNALAGACDGYAEQAEHAERESQREAARVWHDLYAAMLHGAVLGLAVERGEIDPHAAYNLTLAQMMHLPPSAAGRADEYARGHNELCRWLDGEPDGE